MARQRPGRRTPWTAAIVVGASAALLLPFGGIALLGATASLAALVAFIVVDACVVRLRFSRPEAERPFRIAGSVWKIPVLPVLGALGAVAFATQLEGMAYVLMGGALVVIVALLWWGKKRDEADDAATGRT